MIIKNRLTIFSPLSKVIMGTNSNLFRFVSAQKGKFSSPSETKKEETHENMINNNVTDFKDFEKTEIYQDLKTKIKDILEKEKIVLFMKGTPEQPLCGFSASVVQILNKVNVKDYVYIDVMKNRNLREAIKIYSNWPYIPHLYVKNNFIGGCDIVSDLYNKGELENIVK
ncbi:monothiol glutaredoxin [Plasmodium vinckei petteri]|uniref:1-cys-glutaredoxin-like protein-1, putative n=1 Tax=Plasmodium vinckei petteri TaxID=138298 RepID=W7AZ51_PLAVN|nr:monothiol glutaredoxin [Plasmodium vinckei petteri]CAD2097447.1 1-cys-glutaredoxin-like protein-1, putative [Plasmodium vinckei petteri]